MLKYLLFCLICYGITVIVVYSGIPKDIAKRVDKTFRFHFFEDMFECVKCTGFWVGVFLSLLFTFIPFSQFDPWPLENVIWTGFLSSGSCWFLDGLRKD